MSIIYGNWEKLVEAVLRRERDRQLALFESFSSAARCSAHAPVSIPIFLREDVYYLNRPHHPNLVKLIGHGFEEGDSFLVHEFMPNGSLENHLFTRGHQLLSWQTRIKVACGAARGLSFFHALGIIVIHEGVKTSSILLDDDFNAHLSDFDLARAAAGSSDTYPSVRNHCVAPENIGCLTMESDVYSFGIFLLELLSGLRLHDHNQRMKERNLVVWARPFLGNKKKLLQIVDEKLKKYPHDEAYKVGKLASRCLSLDPKLRPRMSEVVDALAQLRCLNTEVKLSSPLLLGPKGTDIQMDHAGSTSWNLVGRASGTSSQMFDPADLSTQKIFFSRNVMALDYAEIRKATKNFGSDSLLGEGGFGRVNKGWIHEHNLSAVKPGSGIAVAVKRLNLQRGQGHHKEWLDEINFLSQLRHPNLVRLIGYSFDKDDRILVYEYMARGSLSNHLFRREHLYLPWATRIKVALGVARAVAFLHGLEVPVIHRNVKSGDILLDGDYNPKLSDFGHAIDGPTGDETYISTEVMGTHGHAAPEYIATGHLTTRCDVYGFGVVLLELLTGLRVIDRKRPTKMHNLINWARPCLKDKRRVLQIMDSRLKGEYPRKEAYTVGKLALQCVSSNPQLRPNMSEVVAALEAL